MYKYIIVQSRWMRSSEHNGERVVAYTGRKREANGLVRHHFHSQLEVLLKHFMYDVEDFHLDEENYAITLADAEGLWFHCQFYSKELFYRR